MLIAGASAIGWSSFGRADELAASEMLLLPGPPSVLSSADLDETAEGAALESDATTTSEPAEELPDLDCPPVNCPLDAAFAAEHDVWLVSSRGANSCGDPISGMAALRFWRGDGSGGWLPSTAEAFHADDDPLVPTLIFVHGNRVEGSEMAEMGWQWYRRMVGGDFGGERVRFVIWTWPSDQIEHHPLEDVRVKASRSEAHAYYLARLIADMPPDTPIGLVGYSYGARFISAALHLVGGGVVARRQLDPPPVDEPRPIRAVLLAAAMDNHWLGAGARHGEALDTVEEFFVFVNCDDPVLRYYTRLYGRGGPEALGRTGVASRRRLGMNDEKLYQVDVTHAVGRNHDWQSYVTSSQVMGRVRQALRFEGLRGDAPPVETDPPPELPMATLDVTAFGTNTVPAAQR